MLSQTSTITDTDPLTGLPVANLGANGFRRRSRPLQTASAAQPTDPPGPHALTSISQSPICNPQSVYTYDANGNMTRH